MSVQFGLSGEGVEAAFDGTNQFMDPRLAKCWMVGWVGTVLSPHFPKSGHCSVNMLLESALQ